MPETNESSGGCTNESLDKVHLILDRVRAERVVFRRELQAFLDSQAAFTKSLEKLKREPDRPAEP